MTSEDSSSDELELPDSPHVEFDPGVKWPEINQVNPVTPADPIGD